MLVLNRLSCTIVAVTRLFYVSWVCSINPGSPPSSLVPGQGALAWLKPMDLVRVELSALYFVNPVA